MAYINGLQANNSIITIKRKKAYIRFNFGPFLKERFLSMGCRVLEIGPGVGDFVEYCNENKVDNVDILDREARILNNIRKKCHVRHTIHSDASEIEEKDLDMYDVIMMTQVLEHLEKSNHIPLIRKLFHRLNKHGVLIVTVPNIGNPLAIFERYYDYTHETAFTENSLEQMTTQANLLHARVLLKAFNIPPYDPVNVLRIICQKLLHLFFSLLYLANGGVYPRIMTTNITLIIEKGV